jgi:hypothetical protein
MKRLRPFVLSASKPPEFPPFCELTKSQRTDNLLAFLGEGITSQRSTLSWEDCPIALRIRRGDSEFSAIALKLAYHFAEDGLDIDMAKVVAQTQN